MKRVTITALAAILSLPPGAALALSDADNSGRNTRDRDEGSVTPGDQSSSDGDVAITRSIRKQLVASDSLSLNAKNAKVIALDGVVTLRGPVKSAAEKAAIAAVAKKTPGVVRVDDQLEIESNP